jgi:hypothetical protein
MRQTVQSTKQAEAVMWDGERSTLEELIGWFQTSTGGGGIRTNVYDADEAGYVVSLNADCLSQPFAPEINVWTGDQWAPCEPGDWIVRREGEWDNAGFDVVNPVAFAERWQPTCKAEALDQTIDLCLETEWTSDPRTPTEFFCPVCKARPAQGHETDCLLRLTLRELEVEEC